MKENIFDWKEYRIWGKGFGDFLKSISLPNFKTKLKENRDEIYCDWAGPLEELIHDEYDSGFYDSEFCEYFTNTYSHILTYHGCRASDIQNYYRNGLLTLNASIQNRNFKKLFCNGHFNEISKDDIDYAIDAMGKENRENRLFLGLDDRTLIGRAGHYLIYGSEYITGLVARLSERLKKDYRTYLRNIGEPTIFKVKLPISATKNADIINLFPHLFEMWVYNKVKRKSISIALDYSIILRKKIPSEYIIGHYHPDEIRDPLNKSQIYIAKTNSYRLDDLSIE
ncbi:MAG: hypothetical protein WAO19_14085 [Candidatus Kryptoniota bacterium]